jgi:hypothetical protein
MSKYRIKKVVEGTDVEYYLQERFWFFWWDDVFLEPFPTKEKAVEAYEFVTKRINEVSVTYEKIK